MLIRSVPLPNMAEYQEDALISRSSAFKLLGYRGAMCTLVLCVLSDPTDQPGGALIILGSASEDCLVTGVHREACPGTDTRCAPAQILSTLVWCRDAKRKLLLLVLGEIPSAELRRILKNASTANAAVLGTFLQSVPGFSRLDTVGIFMTSGLSLRKWELMRQNVNRLVPGNDVLAPRSTVQRW